MPDKTKKPDCGNAQPKHNGASPENPDRPRDSGKKITA
jgi:hypothetical protein